MNVRLRPLAVVVVLCSFVLLIPSARAEREQAVFLLGTGGRIEGELLNGGEKPLVKYVVQTAPGAVITLRADQVKEVVKRTPTDAEYDALRHRQPDTVEGQMALADWCRDHKLDDQRKLHLHRVLELDPAHEKARGQLGYHLLGGTWKTREEHMAALGKVPYKGDWMYPQEIEIVEKKAEAQRVRLEWIANLKRWTDWLGGPKDQTARANIAAISDPAALPALKVALKPDDYPREKRSIPDALAEMYVDAVGRIGTFDAYLLLADLTLIDQNDHVRAASLDILLNDQQPAIVNYYIGQLKSPDNLVVNRAAAALRRFKDERTISPLIDALRTKHKFAVVQGNAGGGMSVSNGPGGPGLAMGGGVKTFTKDLDNATVLDALLTIVNGQVNYQYDQEAWRQWYAGRRKNKFIDSRRS